MSGHVCVAVEFGFVEEVGVELVVLAGVVGVGGLQDFDDFREREGRG